MDSLKKTYLAARLALSKEAEGLKILDLRKQSNFCDFFLILTASSGRRAQAIVDAIREGLDKEGIRIRAQEGGEDSPWMLLDLFDIVVHIFNNQSREFYNLEKLWADAPVMKFPSKKNAPCPVRRLPASASSKGARRRIKSS